MLAADKLQLQSAMKQQATALKEKEFNLHHSNLMTVGTQAAVLAGLDITMFIEFNPPHDGAWEADMKLIPRAIKFIYYIMIVAAFCSNMLVVSHTTVLSVLGAGLALRGPDGSMMTATDGLYEERASVFKIFGYGLGCTVGSVVLGVWLLLNWESALVCMGITLLTCRQIWINYQRVQRRFSYNESDTVDFRDILMSGPSLQAVPNFVRNATDITSTRSTSSHNKSNKRNKKPSDYIAEAPSSAGASFLSRGGNYFTKSRSDGYTEYVASEGDDDDDDDEYASSSDDVELQIPSSSKSAVQRRKGGSKSPLKSKKQIRTV
eukprot:CAMPEP_0119548168 /NCGR_PEP_ID=MMETSP1352-20130426/2149_1 /TAXON_ID=265584 /ORGANISM="Stauroneis constricta, Strain CCMP1120" /LENGTH=319 /DNA_ID=CAMNT_0007593357 /DNA_START=204 /DNA_END=1163 /DNA_ORIENTATION=-